MHQSKDWSKNKTCSFAVAQATMRWKRQLSLHLGSLVFLTHQQGRQSWVSGNELGSDSACWLSGSDACFHRRPRTAPGTPLSRRKKTLPVAGSAGILLTAPRSNGSRLIDSLSTAQVVPRDVWHPLHCRSAPGDKHLWTGSTWEEGSPPFQSQSQIIFITFREFPLPVV